MKKWDRDPIENWKAWRRYKNYGDTWHLYIKQVMVQVQLLYNETIVVADNSSNTLISHQNK